MSKYYISTSLWATDIKEFANDRTAWEELRKLLPHKFATLLKEKEVEVPVNNEESYVEAYNSKYGPRPYGYGLDDAKLMKVGEKNIHTTFVPILEGITDDKYNVIEQPKVDLEKDRGINMTLEEAIMHCKEKACGNTQCALEHRQLAEWLQELQQYRKIEHVRKDAIMEPPKKLKGWVARDKGGNITLYEDKPFRDGERWRGCSWKSSMIYHLFFPDLKWEDEPVEVELTIKPV